MKLNSIFERAVRLCGINEKFVGNNDSTELRRRALAAINTVLFDLCGEPEHDSLSDEVNISDLAFDAAIYGTAMYLTLAFGDTDYSNFFSKIYSGKRAAFKSSLKRVADILPKTGANL